MGIISVCLELDTIGRHQEAQAFVNRYDNHYEIISLIYHEATHKYYTLIECQGQYFCNLLRSQLQCRIIYLTELPTIDTPNGCKIRNAVYFNDPMECLYHYNKNMAAINVQ
jgi:hypothetical protein